MTTTHEHSDHNATSVYISNGYRCQEKTGFFRQKRVYGKRKTPAIKSPVRSFVVAIPLHHYKDSEIQTAGFSLEKILRVVLDLIRCATHSRVGRNYVGRNL